MAGRPRSQGDRYPSGDLKPPKPNPRVVAMRRELLGAGPDDNVDITQAENPLDLAVARGWLTSPQRNAAQEYARLLRRVLTKMPTMRVARSLSDLKVHSQLRPEELGQSRSGVMTAADGLLIKAADDLERGRITPHAYAKLERAHRAAKLDIKRMPWQDIAKVFNAIIDSTPLDPTPHSARAAQLIDVAIGVERDHSRDDATVAAKQRLQKDFELLQTIWSRLEPEEARELVSVCVLQEWPRWITAYIFMRPDDGKARAHLERGLDKLLAVFEGEPPAPPPPREKVKKREEHYDVVDQYGDHMFDLVKLVRA